MRLRAWMAARTAAIAALVAVMPSACGGSSSGSLSAPKVQAARAWSLSGFQPSGPVVPERPTTVEFAVQMPNGQRLTQYKTGPGPHTGRAPDHRP